MEGQGSTEKTAWLPRRVLDDLPSLFSLAAFFGAAALLFRSWEFALMVTASLGFHELGHVAALALSGLDWRISFSLAGAYTWSSAAQRQRLTHLHNAAIHLAGPVFSLLLSLLAMAIYRLWLPGDEHLLLLANFSAQLGLLNLLPFGRVTDGGKIVQRLAASYPPGPARNWAALLPLLVSALMLLGTTLLAPATSVTLLSLLLIGLWLSGSLIIEMAPQKLSIPVTGAAAPGAARERIAPVAGYALLVVVWALLALAMRISAATPFWLAPHYLWGSLTNAAEVLFFFSRAIL